VPASPLRCALIVQVEGGSAFAGIRAESITERNHLELLIFCLGGPRPEQSVVDDCGPAQQRPRRGGLQGLPMRWIQPEAAAIDVYAEASAAVVSIALAWPLPEPISILRGLACSATGIVTVKTPVSYLASMCSGSRPSPRNN
jgi:hypothetical protein